jgi:single-strand DNA-binding protein
MADFNRVYVIGNLVKDPEMKDISSTRKVTNFTVAVNRKWKGSEGEEGSEVSYLDCAAYGKKAEIIDQYFSKGRRIFVEGRLKQDKWEDKETKKTHSKIRIVVENFHFMDSKKQEAVTSKSPAIPASAGNDAPDDMPTFDDDFDAI